MRHYLVSIILFVSLAAGAQDPVSYFIGDTSDVITTTTAGTVLMGGATENDNAMRWFLERSGGGDILVLRASGADGYNDYLYTLGILVNSVETIVCPDSASANDPYVLQQIQRAEAIWFAGGDQWDYIRFWKNTLIEDALNAHIQIKQAPIGGTSAGCAIQGDGYFSAENGTIVSSQALNDPFHALMTLGYSDFLENPLTEGMITDTHFDNPDRRGRMVVFMARLVTESGIAFRGIGIEEYTAVCIDENNIAHVYGSYPSYDDYAFFIQANCYEPSGPEVCEDGEKLTWDRNDAAVKVIRMGGTNSGSGFVDLNDWKTAGGADFTWQDWWVENGAFSVTENTEPIDCTVSITENGRDPFWNMFPQPARGAVTLTFGNAYQGQVAIMDLSGRKCLETDVAGTMITLDIKGFQPGIYLVRISGAQAEKLLIVL